LSEEKNLELPVPEQPDTLDVGWLEVCLNVKDLKTSIAFYEKLGFYPAFGDPDEGWVIMESEQALLGLYQGHIPQNLITFRTGDIQQIADTLKERGLKLKSEVVMEPDGSLGCTIEDPDGNLIYFNTHPDELLEDGCDCDCEEGECDCEEGKCDCGDEHHHHHHHGEEDEKKA